MLDFKIDDKLTDVKATFEVARSKASRYFMHPSELKVILDEATLKAERTKRALKPAYDHLMTFVDIVRNVVAGTELPIPKNDVIKIIAGLVYFVSPVDVFPDFIPAFGFMDDIFIIGLVAAATNTSIQAFKNSQKSTSDVG